MTGARPQAVIFDVFGSLVDWRAGVARAAAEALPGVDAPAFADAWRGRYQPSMAAVRDGRRPYVALDVLHRENLDATLAAFGLDPPEADRAALNHAWERLPAWPDAAEGLARLRRAVIVAPCSNGSIALMTRLSRFAGLGWDCILGADVARAYKPDPQAYLGSAAALGLAPGAVMMAAAHNSDLAAAREAGLATAFFPRPAEHGPAGGETEATGPWDVVATDVMDLATQLGAP